MKRKFLSLLSITALASAPFTLLADSAGPACSAAGKACSAATLTSQVQKSSCGVDCDKPCCAEAKTSAKLTKVNYEVKDLSCAACETKVTQALSALGGVSQAKACSKEKQVQVAFDPKKLNDKQLIAAIRTAGFNVSAETIEVKVNGMKCGACSGKVSKALAEVPGIQKQEVCHESGKALVKFDPNTVSRQKVLSAIDQTGFETVQ